MSLFGRCFPICFAGVQLVAALGWGVGSKDVWKGVCYTPVPNNVEGLKFTQDDFMTEAAKPMWGPHGRGDLLTIKALGANKVRMYGNNPANDHGTFLSYAHEVGLQVIVGISNWPYNQMSGNCKASGHDCFEAVKGAYINNLQRGFVTPQRTYHPAISHLIVINEPDLQLGHSPENFTFQDPKLWVKGVISAIDGVISAEKQMNITGDLIGLTVTMTFGVCNLCDGQDVNGKHSTPSLGQMLELRKGLLDPQLYGYTPVNNLTHVFETRFFNSLNTQNPAPEVSEFFLERYVEEFDNTAVFFEEYHSFWQWGYQAQLADLQDILQKAADSPLILGINFFEFQISWQKYNSKDHSHFDELFFGIFGVGDYKIKDLNYYTTWTPLQCLSEVSWNQWASVDKKCEGLGCFQLSGNITQAVTTAFGGTGVNAYSLCTADSKKVPLTSVGYSLIKSSPTGCDTNMVTFVQRLVLSLGGLATMNRGLLEFCRKYCSRGSHQHVGGEPDFATLMLELRDSPSWAYWSFYKSCVANRESDTYSVGRTIELLCSQRLKYFDCVNVPWHCKTNTWLTADYVYSTYFNELQADGDPNPLQECYFNGTALYASATYQYEERFDTACIVSTDPEATPLDDQGYAVIRRTSNAVKSKKFIARFLEKTLNATVCSARELYEFSERPPASLYDLTRDLADQWWICGGNTGRVCDPCEQPDEGGLLGQPWFLAVLAATSVVLCITCVVTCYYARTLPEESEEWARRHQCKAAFRYADDAIVATRTTRGISIPEGSTGITPSRSRAAPAYTQFVIGTP